MHIVSDRIENEEENDKKNNKQQIIGRWEKRSNMRRKIVFIYTVNGELMIRAAVQMKYWSGGKFFIILEDFRSNDNNNKKSRADCWLLTAAIHQLNDKTTTTTTTPPIGMLKSNRSVIQITHL